MEHGFSTRAESSSRVENPRYFGKNPRSFGKKLRSFGNTLRASTKTGDCHGPSDCAGRGRPAASSTTARTSISTGSPFATVSFTTQPVHSGGSQG